MNHPTSPRRSPGPTYQEIVARDAVAPEAVITEESSTPVEIDRIAPTVYTTRAEHDREVAAIWDRAWQVVGRAEQLPEPGDSLVYDVADRSYLVVRDDDGTIRAFPNACAHRGTRLRTGPETHPEIRCPFHGWTWDLDGTLQAIPCDWDFEHLDRDELALPALRVAEWNGWVFVCPSADTMPFDEFIGDLSRWFPWSHADRALAGHVRKELPCNWKVAMEAFLESYHVVATHPQLLPSLADSNTQYDVWSDQPRWNRMITAQGAQSPHLDDLTDQEILDSVLEQFVGEGMSIPLPDGVSARQAMTGLFKAQLPGVGLDEEVSEAEALDAIQYWVFPNFVPWGGWSRINYLFRPLGDDPDRSVMDVYLLDPFDPDTGRPAPAEVRELADEDPWTDAPELGPLADIFTQDSSNLGRIQAGLHTTRFDVHPAAYQEVRIRHFHQERARWLDARE